MTEKKSTIKVELDKKKNVKVSWTLGKKTLNFDYKLNFYKSTKYMVALQKINKATGGGVRDIPEDKEAVLSAELMTALIDFIGDDNLELAQSFADANGVELSMEHLIQFVNGSNDNNDDDDEDKTPLK